MSDASNAPRSPANTLLALTALVCTALCHALATPPRHMLWVMPFMWIPGMLVIRRLSGRRALFAGWLIGTIVYVATLNWIPQTIERFTNLPPVVAYVLVTLCGVLWGFSVGVFAAAFGPVARRSGAWWPVTGALLYTATEYLNPQLFPWTQSAPWYTVPEVFLITSLGGSAILTFGLLLLNLTCVAAIEQVRDRPEAVAGALRRGGATAVAFAALTLGWSQYRLGVIEAAEAEADPVTLGLIQSNRDVFDIRKLAKKGPEEITRDLVALSEQAMAEDGDIDAIVWPEGAISSHPDRKRHRSLRRFAKKHDVEVWLGASFRLRGEKRPMPRHAGAFRLGADGEVAGRYDKNVLLPFGEFMPLAETFPILKKIQGVGNFVGGDEMTVFEGAPASFAFLICYEATRARLARRAAQGGAELLVNITYDGWFGDTDCPHQHFMLSAGQAGATGIPLVRAATTGISAVVDARGVPRATTDVFVRDVLVADVKPLAVPSVYVALGDWFAQGALVVAFALLLLGGRTAPQRRSIFGAALVLLLAAPLSWRINPHVPIADYLAWGLAVAMVIAGLAGVGAKQAEG